MAHRIRKNNGVIEILDTPGARPMPFLGKIQREAHGITIDIYKYYTSEIGFIWLLSDMKYMIPMKKYTENFTSAAWHFSENDRQNLRAQISEVRAALSRGERQASGICLISKTRDFQMGYMHVNRPMIFLTKPSRNGDASFLVNRDGYVIPGLNTHSDGRLCLGDDPDVFTDKSLDALIFNRPNMDISWHGSALMGEYTHADKTFKITSSWRPDAQFGITDQVKEELRRLFPTS